MSARQGGAERQEDCAVNIPPDIQALFEALSTELELGFEVDRPASPGGEWWLDLDIGGMPATVSWREGAGFGLYIREEAEAGIGDRPDEIYREPHKAAHRLLQLAATWKASASRSPLGLRDVRHLAGGTQSEIAQSLGMDQAGVSRLEKRGDWKLSTLRDYVAALGGILELRVRFHSFEAPLEPAGTARPNCRTRSR
jgi:hypothetical protein